ncbi:hypothetical protein KC330_g4024 [Hortaea werneckii]|nr:hypothetical protein KC330_g4024 [Hortaea werneckii]
MKPTTAILLTTSTLLTTLSAQQNYAIDPDSVDDSTKETWCTNQQTQCPLICTQTTPSHSADTQTNTCDPTSLTYACICANGQSPNISEYSQTLPYYICQEWTNQCVANCAQADNACASSCRDDHPCGALNPTRVNSSTEEGRDLDAGDTYGLYYLIHPIYRISCNGGEQKARVMEKEEEEEEEGGKNTQILHLFDIDID